MIGAIILHLIGATAAPRWLTKPVSMAVDVVGAAFLLWGLVTLIHHDGEKAGAARVTAKVEQQHAKAVAEASGDGRVAQAVADHVAVKVAHQDGAAEAALRDQITELHHELDTTSALPGAGAPVADTGRLSAPLNTLVDRANRAAEAADAVP